MPTFHFKKNRNRPEGQPQPAPKPDVPDALCLKCQGCGQTLFTAETEENFWLCKHCGHHFRLDAEKRIELVCDADSFTPLDTDVHSCDPLNFPGYAAKLAENGKKHLEEVLCGQGKIEGQPCCLFAMNPIFMMGSMGSATGEKITRLFEYAQINRLPVVGFTLSGGARMQEGALSLMQMAKISGAVKRHSDAGLLYITVLCDPTTGGVTASFAMEGDVLLAEPGALIAFAGPRVIEQTLRQKLPKNFQRAEFLLEKGFLDAVIPRPRLKATLAQLLKLHSPGKLNPPSAAQTPRPAPPEGEEEVQQDAYEVVKKAREAQRPSGKTYIKKLCSEFIELRGDRRFADDHAIIGGVGRLCGLPVTVLAQEKGEDINERARRNFGMAHPEGYRKALRLMKQAEKFGRPVLCLVDTSGAYCGIGAEERGQGQAIAENLMEMMALKVPVITLLMGEGGSGGALALAVADRVWMMENSVYSVISPEGCASILYKDASKAAEAANCLKITPKNLKQLGVIEEILPEGEGQFDYLKMRLAQTYAELCALPQDALCDQRYGRFRKMGCTESTPE